MLFSPYSLHFSPLCPPFPYYLSYNLPFFFFPYFIPPPLPLIVCFSFCSHFLVFSDLPVCPSVERD
jgi:hypothetical protein